MSVSTGMILHGSTIVVPESRELSNFVRHENAGKILAAFPWDVQKLELYGPNGETTGLFGLFIVRDGVIGEQISDSSVSAKYSPHNVEDVSVLVEAAMDVFGESAILKMHWKNGHFVTVQPSKAERMSIFNSVDNVFPTLSIFGGYNGKGFEGGLLAQRDACSNLARVQTVGGTCMSIRHTKNMYKRMGELQDVFGSLAGKWNEVCAVVQRLEEKKVNLVEFLRAMYDKKEEQSKAGVTRTTNRIDDIKTRVIRDAYKVGRDTSRFMSTEPIVTGWEAYNGLQGYLQHDTLAASRAGNDLGRVLQTLNGTTETLLLSAERYLIG